MVRQDGQLVNTGQPTTPEPAKRQRENTKLGANMLYKAKMTICGHTYYFVTRNKDVSQLGGLWSKHCSDCCSNILPDIQVFSHHLLGASVSKHQPDANKVFSA